MLEILRKILPSLGWDFRLNLGLPETRLPSPFDRAFVALESEDDVFDEEAVEEEEWEDELVDDGWEDKERLEYYWILFELNFMVFSRHGRQQCE